MDRAPPPQSTPSRMPLLPLRPLAPEVEVLGGLATSIRPLPLFSTCGSGGMEAPARTRGLSSPPPP